MKKTLKLLALILSITMLFAMFAACSDSGAGETTTPGSNAGGSANGSDIYPLTGDNLELTVWTTFQSPSAGYINGYSEFSAVQEAERQTGVHIEWIEFSPPVQAEQLMISVSGGDYPDLYRNFLANYKASGSQAFDDGVILKLNDLLEQYAPNYLATVNSSDSNYKNAVDDDGNFWMVYAYMTEFRPVSGLTVRQDWLDELNLNVPTTFDELEDVLTAFKTTYDTSSALLVQQDNYIGSFLITNGFHATGLSAMVPADAIHQINGKVVYGPIQDNFKAYLEQMNKWYNAGLFSRDFATISGNTKGPEQMGMIASGETGVFDASTQLFADFKAMADDPDFSIIGIETITVDGDATTHFTNKALRANRNGYAVTTDCENVEVAIRWIDWWFSEEGSLVANYGTQGESWEYVDGVPSYTDLVMNSSMTDLSLTQAANYYSVYNEVVALFDEWRLRQIYTDAEIASMQAWDASTDGDYLLPLGITLTADESSSVSTILTDVNTYASENIARFITGEKSFSDWGGFVSDIEGMGLQSILDVYQAAFNRYNSR